LEPAGEGATILISEAERVNVGTQNKKRQEQEQNKDFPFVIAGATDEHGWTKIIGLTVFGLLSSVPGLLSAMTNEKCQIMSNDKWKIFFLNQSREESLLYLKCLIKAASAM
jgi:hypothetical protein